MSEDKKTSNKTVLIKKSASIPAIPKVTTKEGTAAASADVIKFKLTPRTPVKKK